MNQNESQLFDLERFVDAQSGKYQAALEEIRRGQKRSHWMWFIFPQLKGLGVSPTSEFYGIAGVDEAKAYLQHEVLGARLLEISDELLKLEGQSANEVFGYPDDLKLRSSTTLFAFVSEPESVFHRILDEYFAGERCQRSLAMLEAK